MPIYAVNVPVTTYQQLALTGYHFLSWCAQFPIIKVTGANFSGSTILEASTARVNAATPSRLFATSAVFTASHVGKYVALRDASNPSNTGVFRITSFVSATEVQLNAPIANFTITSTNLPIRIFDGAVLPVAGNYFVFGNIATQFPNWQCRVTVDGGGSVVTHEFAPIGGYNAALNTWNGPVSNPIQGWTTIAQAFFFADPAAGWYFTMTEDVGGVGSNRNGAWMGTVGSTHAAPAAGFPADTSYAGILGTDGSPMAHNIGRATTTNNLISAGVFGNPDGSTTIRGYLRKRTLSGAGTDPLTVAAAATNPRTGAQDDFDFIVMHRSPLAIRGFIPGLRIMADAIANRTLTSSGATYCLGNGIGFAWNGKPIV